MAIPGSPWRCCSRPCRGTTRSPARPAGSGCCSCSPGLAGRVWSSQTNQLHPLCRGCWMWRPRGGKKNNPKNTRAGGFERLEGASWAKRKNIPGRSGNVQGEMQPGGKISWDLPDGIQNRDSAAPGVNSSWALSREVPGGSSPFPAPLEGFLLGQTPRWSSGPNSWARTLWSSWTGCNS